MEVKGHFLFPLATLTKVQAVDADKPVWARNHFHHHGQLLRREKTEFTEFKECSVSSNVTIWTFAFNSKHSCGNCKWTELLTDRIVQLDLVGHFFAGWGAVWVCVWGRGVVNRNSSTKTKTETSRD